MEPITDFTVYLEEYIKLFVDFFTASNNLHDSLTRPFSIMINMPKEVTPAKFIIKNF